jgi:hypothetical protein
MWFTPLNYFGSKDRRVAVGGQVKMLVRLYHKEQVGRLRLDPLTLYKNKTPNGSKILM